jgi:hypothetical protein
MSKPHSDIAPLLVSLEALLGEPLPCYRFIDLSWLQDSALCAAQLLPGGNG